MPKGVYKRRTAKERFSLHVRKTRTCWLWIGHKTSAGYGQIMQNYTNIYAHRLSYEIHTGTVPRGMCVLHRCDRPQCVRPLHLFLGTHLDNMKDAAAKGRMNGKLGVPRPRICKRHNVLNHGCGNQAVCRHGQLAHNCGGSFHKGRRRSMSTRRKIAAAARRRYSEKTS